MIRRNQGYLNKLQILMDAIIIVAAYLSAWLIKFKSVLGNEAEGRLSIRTYLYGLVILVPLYLILYAVFHLYTPKRVQARRNELFAIIEANTIGVILFILVLYIVKQIDFSRSMMLIFYGLNIVYEYSARFCLRRLLRKMRKKGFNQKHIVLVGYSRAAEGYIDRIKSFPQWGYRIVGILDDNVEVGTSYRNEKVIGRVSDIKDILNENDIDEMTITLGLGEYDKLEEIVSICEKSGVHTKFIPDYNNIIPTIPYIEDVEGLPVINIRHVPLSDGFNKFAKRILDIVLGFIALIIALPVMLIVMILIKVTSKGPVIYKQKRVGLHNKEFEMYKFRSMRVENDGSDTKKWTTNDDPRVTGIGKIIRKTSIDELPQLINVLKGDMSLIGPRPERRYFVEQFKEEIPRYMIKHQVRPGMTGWAQVNGYRGDTDIRKRIEFDLYYIENWSFLFDLKIMVLTVFKGFINKNAY